MPATLIQDEQTTRPVFGAMFSVDQIIRANREVGGHYFDADTMRFFKSKVLPTVYAGRFFVTSERSDYSSPRLYTVREFMPDGTIETVGEFQGYSSAAQARSAIQRLRKEDATYYFDVRHGKAGRRRTYVVTAPDAWAAMDRLHSNARVRFCGRAADYMTAEKGYVVL